VIYFFNLSYSLFECKELSQFSIKNNFAYFSQHKGENWSTLSNIIRKIDIDTNNTNNVIEDMNGKGRQLNAIDHSIRSEKYLGPFHKQFICEMYPNWFIYCLQIYVVQTIPSSLFFPLTTFNNISFEKISV